MKCPKCNANHKYSVGMHCYCGYSFVFDPKIDKFADGRFIAIVRAVSANGTYYFTKNQFFAHFCWRLSKNWQWAILVGGIAAVLTIIAIVFSIIPLIFISGFFTLIGMGIGLGKLYANFPDRIDVDSWFHRWQNSGQQVEKLLDAPQLANAPPENVESDLYDYGMERLLIVQHRILVDLLVLNGLHAQERVLIICQDGYPEYLVAHAQQMLQDNPQLPVFLLHDSFPTGTRMRAHLQNSQLFSLANHIVVDLGLFPEDSKHIKKLRALRRKYKNGMAVDFLAYHQLRQALSSGMSARQSFGEMLLLASGVDAASDSGTSFG